MRAIITGRQMGKTRRIVKEMIANEKAICLVPTWDQADVVINQARREFGEHLSVKRFITPKNNVALFGQRQPIPLLVDNLELVLSAMYSGCTIDLVTATGTLESMSGMPELDE